MVQDQNLKDNDGSESIVNAIIPLKNKGDKSKKCNQCNYVSSCGTNLKVHLKMHSGVKQM